MMSLIAKALKVLVYDHALSVLVSSIEEKTNLFSCQVAVCYGEK